MELEVLWPYYDIMILFLISLFSQELNCLESVGIVDYACAGSTASFSNLASLSIVSLEFGAMLELRAEGDCRGN